jgi:phage head maturation protease
MRKMVIKYAPSVIALEAPIASDKPLKVDTKRMTAKGLLATEARDRQGDILDVAGLDTSDHERNPVVLLDHGKYYPLPIGVTRTPEGLYTVEVDPIAGEVWQTTHFSQKSQVAEQVFALIAEGVMRGNSIGFRMVEADHLQPDMERGFQRNKDGDAGKLIKRSELVECSWCGVPVNPEAARAAVGKSWCGKSLADPIRNAFRRYLPTGKAVVRSGWDATEKAMLDWHRAANHLVEKSQGITFSHDYLLWSAKAGFEYIIKAEEASDETAEEAGEDPDEVVSDDADAIDPEVIAELLYGLYGDRAMEMIRAVYEENEQEEEPSSEVQKAFWTYLQKAWNAADHPRGKGGRFIAKGSGEAVNAAQQVISDVIGGKSTASPKDVMDHLSILTVKQIRELGQKHGKKIPKMLRAELVDAVQQLIDGKPKEAAPEPKPAPTKPEAEPTAGIPSTPKKGVAYNVPTDQLSVDPSRFQYKLNTDASGVTAELKSVKQFNPDFAGVISVWKDPADGKTYVVNGHHRTELARRLGHPDLAVRYIEAGDSKEARAIGALINIAEGRGTAIDAAKFMRDAGAGPEELEARGVSLRGKVAADAAVLTSLSDRLFQRLSTGLLDENKAIAVAKHLKDHDLQNSLVDMLDKREEEGKDLPMRVVEEMAKEMAMTPTTTKREASLFGDLESTESLFVPRNEIKSHVRMEFARELGDFAAGSSKRRAEVLAKFGNLLDVDTNKTLAEQAEQVKNVFDTLVNRKGAISDSINQLASEYVNAKTRRERDAIKDRATEAVREAIQQELASGSIGGQQVDTGATGPAGQPGQGNAEGSAAQALSAQPGGGDSQPAGLTPPDDPRIQDALNRYDGRDQTPGTGGGLFGGDDIRSRDLIDKLPDGAKVVMTEGSMRGKVGSLHREESLDGSSRLVWRPEGSDESFQVYPASLEPLEAHQSWRTEAGAGGRNQNDMFAGTFKPSKMADDDFTPTPQDEPAAAPQDAPQRTPSSKLSAQFKDKLRSQYDRGGYHVHGANPEDVASAVGGKVMDVDQAFENNFRKMIEDNGADWDFVQDVISDPDHPDWVHAEGPIRHAWKQTVDAINGHEGNIVLANVGNAMSKYKIDPSAIGGIQGMELRSERDKDGSVFIADESVKPLSQRRAITNDVPQQEAESAAPPATPPAKEPWRSDALSITKESLPNVMESVTREIANHDPKLSENRAKELASARIRNAIHAKVADIDDRARRGNITDAEEEWYDAIHVHGWSPTRDLERLSGSRTIGADADHPIANKPLSEQLEDTWTPKKEEAERNRKTAEGMEQRRSAPEEAPTVADNNPEQVEKILGDKAALYSSTGRMEDADHNTPMIMDNIVESAKEELYSQGKADDAYRLNAAHYAIGWMKSTGRIDNGKEGKAWKEMPVREKMKVLSQMTQTNDASVRGMADRFREIMAARSSSPSANTNNPDQATEGAAPTGKQVSKAKDITPKEAASVVRNLYSDIDKGIVDERYVESSINPLQNLTIKQLHQVLDELNIAEKPASKNKIMDKIRQVVRMQMESRDRAMSVGRPTDPSANTNNPEAKKKDITPEEAAARKWTKNDDGTYTAPNGTVWRKAKEGGEISPVTGQPFKGGSLMPIHGRSVKADKEEFGTGGQGGAEVGTGGRPEKKKKDPSQTKPRRQEMARDANNQLVPIPDGHLSIQNLLTVHPSASHTLSDTALSYLGLTRKQANDLKDIFQESATIPSDVAPRSSYSSNEPPSDKWNIKEKYEEWKRSGQSAPAAESAAHPAAAPAKEPWEMSKNEFESSALNGKESAEKLDAIRAGDARSKNRGELRKANPESAHVLVNLPIDTFTPEDIQHLRESTNAERVASYVGQDIDTPIHATPKRKKDGFVLNDGGHRVLAAIERGDKTIPALVPADSHRLHVAAALAAGKPVPPEVLADYPDLAGKQSTAPAAPPSGGKGTSQLNAGRTKDSKPITFAKPIVGPSGAKLNGYEWKWTWGQKFDNREDGIVDAKISDWENSEASSETGKQVVHQFNVTDRNGESHLVSLEGAARMLGFAPDQVAQFKNVSSAVKTLAKNQMIHAAMTQEYENLDRLHREAEKQVASETIPEPVVSKDGDAWRVAIGDYSHRYFGPRARVEPTQEEIERAKKFYREHRINNLVKNQLPAGSQVDKLHMEGLQHKLRELDYKIKKQRKRVDDLAGKFQAKTNQDADQSQQATKSYRLDPVWMDFHREIDSLVAKAYSL